MRGSGPDLEGGAGEGLPKVGLLALLVQVQLPDTVQRLVCHVRHSVHPHLSHQHALCISHTFNPQSVVRPRLDGSAAGLLSATTGARYVTSTELIRQVNDKCEIETHNCSGDSEKRASMMKEQE